MNRGKQLKRNTIWSLFYELLTIICGFILPRYFLLYYGTDINGLQSSITQFLGIISLCELGLGAVIPASLYKPLAEKDYETVSKVYVSSQRFYNIIGFIMILYVVLLILIYPSIISHSYSFLYTGSLIFIIAISTVAQYFFGITNTLLLKSDQKQYIPLVINSITLIINTVISILLVVLGCSIHVVKLLSAVIFIVRPLYLNWYVRHHYSINRRIVYDSEPIKQKWNGIAQHLAYTIQDKIGVIVLTLMSSLANVSVFGVYYMLINGVRGLLYSLTSGISAYFGNILANGENSVFRKTFELFEWLFHVLTILVFALLSICVVGFVDIYTTGVKDAQIYHTPLFAFIFCAAMAFRCLQLPYNTVVQTIGHFKETQNSAIIEPFINIIICFAAVQKLGLVGVALGSFVSMLYRFLYLSLYVDNKVLLSSHKRLLKIITFDIIIYVAIVSLGRLMYFNISTFALNWAIQIVLSSIIAVLIISVLSYFIFPDNFCGVFKIVANTIKRK